MNWLQNLYSAVNTIPGVNDNSATLVFDIYFDDPLTFPPTAVDVQITRNLTVCNLGAVAVQLIDGANYKSGDWQVRVDYISMKNAQKPLPDDPPVVIGGITKTLDDLRPWDEATAALDIASDDMVFAGKKYTIAKVEGGQWLNSTPAYYTLTLRGGIPV